MMRRLTQLLASILFIITVLTVYIVFDFAVTSATPKKYSNKDKHEHTITKVSSVGSLLNLKKFNQTLKHHDNDQERRTRSLKPRRNLVKPAPFHKSKTGIKINQMKKPFRKRLSTTRNPSIKTR